MSIYFVMKIIIFVMMEVLIVFVIFACYFVLKIFVIIKNTSDV